MLAKARPMAHPPPLVRQMSRRLAQRSQRPKRSVAAMQEGRRVRALFKRLGMPTRLHRRGMAMEEAREVALVWLGTSEAAKARRRRYIRSWSRRQRARKGGMAVATARLGCTPPSAASQPSHWALVRTAVRLRSIAFYWMEETVRSLCAPEGRYRLEDLEAFLRDLDDDAPADCLGPALPQLA